MLANLKPEERQLYFYLQARPSTINDLAEFFKVSKSTLWRRLRRLQEEGIKIRKEVGKNRFYFYSCERAALEDLLEASPEPPISSYEEPTELAVGEDFRIGFANTIFAGGRTNKELFKNFLKYCKETNVDAVVLTGNLIWLDLSRYSKYKPDRSRMVDSDVEKNLESKVNSYKDGPKYLTFKERIDVIIQDALRPLFYEDSKPIYDGDIYIIFGEMEEELVRQHTNDAVKIECTKQEKRCKERIAKLRKELEKAKKQNDEKAISSLQKEIESLAAYKDKITMNRTDPSFIKKVEKAMQGYIVEKLEAAIPNAKVVSTGTGYLKAGKKIIKIIPTPAKTGSTPSDDLMSKLKVKIKEDLHYGKPVGDVVVAGGLSTTYTYNPLPYHANGEERLIPLIQLFTCLNTADLGRTNEGSVKSGSILSKMPLKGDFNSGAAVLGYQSGVFVQEILREEFLTNKDVFREKITFSKLFYEANFADEHWGSKYMALIETEDYVVPAFVIAQQLLAEIDAPIVRINFLGDELQEKNYPTEAEGHPEWLSPSQLEEKLRELSSPEKEKLVKRNAYRAGILMPMDQYTDFMRNLNIELIKSCIKKANEVRYVGPRVLFINGNHNENTFEGMYVTSVLLARELRLRLGYSIEETSKPEAEQKEIKAPMLGNTGLYEGTFGISGHGFYGEYNMHKQKGSKTKDQMRGQRVEYTNRGRGGTLFLVNRSAHDHIGGLSLSKNGLHLKLFCFQERNAYGEKYGFGSPTLGFFCCGYPSDGAASGPLVYIEFPLSYLASWAAKKRQVDVKKIFKHSII